MAQLGAKKCQMQPDSAGFWRSDGDHPLSFYPADCVLDEAEM